MNRTAHGLSKKVDLNILRYANCWEDADVLLQALELKGGERIFCIASGGDNALALLTKNPSLVCAVDINPVQLYLTELKQQAFGALSYTELLSFFGVMNATAGERLQLYFKVRPALSQPASQYWDGQKQCIKKGVLCAGKFERYFAVFRNYLLPLVHRHGTLQKLLNEKEDAEQLQFFNHTWNSRRWKLLMQLFFNRHTLGRYGRDPLFLKHVSVNVPDYIIGKSNRHLQASECTRNYFLHLIMTGQFGPALPVYLRKENFECIKQNTGRLVLQQAAAQTAVKEQPFHAYCFSNMFEYLSAQLFQNLIQECAPFIPSRAKLAYWNLMVHRRFSDVAPHLFTYQAQKSKAASAQDKGFFYHSFILDEKK
jgi:S-adenosylmethionine-diacylglycerol 3-amino-3-carboxypropyl transferase